MRKRTKLAIAGLGCWMAASEALAIRYDGETPAKTYRELHYHGEGRLKSAFGTVAIHVGISTTWLALTGVKLYDQKRVRAARRQQQPRMPPPEL